MDDGEDEQHKQRVYVYQYFIPNNGRLSKVQCHPIPVVTRRPTLVLCTRRALIPLESATTCHPS